MKHIRIDPLDLLNFPRRADQEVTEWVSSILAAKGVHAGRVTGHHMDSHGHIIVEYDDGNE